jgi:acyl-CoA thioester hydrolase
MMTFQHRVRYHETDAQGFVFNARFLEFADVAMTEFLRDLEWPYDKLVAEGADPSVVTAQLTFRSPARFDDVLDIAATCTRVGASSFDLAVKLTRDGQAIADVALVYVNVNAASATSRPLPPALAAALRSALVSGSVG